MKRQELYTQAVQAIELRRQQAEIKAAQKREALYAAHPILQELDRQKTQAGAAAAVLAAGGQSSAAQEKLAQIQEIDARRRVVLKTAGVGEDELVPMHRCTLCGDTGRYKGKVCRCVLAEMKKMRRSEINRTSSLRLCRFDTFRLDLYPDEMEQDGTRIFPRQTMELILADCRDWATDFGPHSQSLYMYGYSGLGKTHLALSIASEVLEAGYDVIYVSVQRVFSILATDRDAGEDLFESMMEADLLVLDDLGTEVVTAFSRARLYELINERMGKRPTIYTSNICRRDVLEGRYDEKVCSRLLGNGCHPMRFWGHDIRMMKSPNQL